MQFDNLPKTEAEIFVKNRALSPFRIRAGSGELNDVIKANRKDRPFLLLPVLSQLDTRD